MAPKKTKKSAEDPPPSSTPTPTTPSSPKKKINKNKSKPTPTSQSTNTATTPIPADKSNNNKDATPKADTNPTPKKGFPQWSIEEDKKLCIAWLNTSRDAIVGKGQKATTFWERIHATLTELITEYNEEKNHSRNFKPLPLRPVGAVECRWGLILKSVNKFAGFYSNLSGAKELYKTTLGLPFNLDHCWGILKDTPKWQATQRENEARTKKTTKSETAAPSTDASSSVVAVSSPWVVDIEDNDSGPSRSVLGNGRVKGQKAAKRE
ncbi:uncharacterized protein PGTG_13332 [Puccinia graminis f. sp. tritici CRL 75-36-700-3]|uniref:No apical meristem-associated C-terminal domain-containing protein n=1 Tax=Puccinia graminis f. sp. tritici (strain CRL 75-36-700-3 / race SCCL) TaxID=418459 RepID=E3KS38_PUCGT|nr:uncharacterized protein PGTG_13332 [Puccinia graminis f. sp. tritici CRL 75-36-700-3]EFP87113.1 hypothetical protein PGTG_13332 [Puccinia graminis f. sp. tritici CRL 75-36-700-3]